MRRLLMISLLPLVVACTGPTTPRVAPAAGPAGIMTAPRTDTQAAATQSDPQRASRTQARPTGNGKPEPPAAPAWPYANVRSPADNHGIVIGQPLKVGANSTVVLVTNSTDHVMTFNIATTVRKGGSEMAAIGTVADLLPGESRPAIASSTSLLPSDPDSVSVAVTGVRNAASSTPKSESARKIAVSEPKPVANSSTVTVEVTNGDSKPLSVALYTAYLQGDELIGYGEGQAAGLKPGETRTITLRPVTPVRPSERVSISARVI